jgi:hypothetical protein
LSLQISSNFERFLFHTGGDDALALKGLMKRFEQGGALDPPPELLAACRKDMDSERVADEVVLATIAQVKRERSTGGEAMGGTDALEGGKSGERTPAAVRSGTPTFPQPT